MTTSAMPGAFWWDVMGMHCSGRLRVRARPRPPRAPGSAARARARTRRDLIQRQDSTSRRTGRQLWPRSISLEPSGSSRLPRSGRGGHRRGQGHRPGDQRGLPVRRRRRGGVRAERGGRGPAPDGRRRRRLGPAGGVRGRRTSGRPTRPPAVIGLRRGAIREDRHPGQQRRGFAPGGGGRRPRPASRLDRGPQPAGSPLLRPGGQLLLQGQEEGGSIVNIASVSGLRPSPGTAAYGAAKAGLISLTQSLAMEWAPKVRVNAVTAGIVATEGADDHYGGTEGMAGSPPPCPSGRFGTPADVAGPCLFLASPLAAYVTGTNLVAHGGGEWPAFLTAVAAACPTGAAGRRRLTGGSPAGRPAIGDESAGRRGGNRSSGAHSRSMFPSVSPDDRRAVIERSARGRGRRHQGGSPC